MADKKQLRTLLLKLAVRKFQEQAKGKISPKKENFRKFDEVKQNDSKPNEKQN